MATPIDELRAHYEGRVKAMTKEVDALATPDKKLDEAISALMGSILKKTTELEELGKETTTTLNTLEERIKKAEEIQGSSAPSRRKPVQKPFFLIIQGM